MLFDEMQNVAEEERKAFGKNWVGPDQISRDWTKVAHFPKEEGGDGQPFVAIVVRQPEQDQKVVG